MADKQEKQTAEKKSRSRADRQKGDHSVHPFVTILVALLAGFIGAYIGLEYFPSKEVSFDRQAAEEVVVDEGRLISELVKEVGPSVVSVNVLQTEVTRDPFFGFESRGVERQSAGTGVILDDEGVVITNRHVVPEGTTDVSITLSDGTELDDIEIIGRTNQEDSLDVAFLRIRDKKGKDLTPAQLGSSIDTDVGARVIAIGNALGQFQNTVTSGIVSGFGRSVMARGGSSIDSLQNLIQTDAAINQGNSGGPLVNSRGEVIGINTAVAGGSAEGIGFAIPIDDIKGLIAGVLEDGELQRPYIGVRFVNLTEDYAYEVNLDQTTGAYLAPGSARQPTILPDSPAEKAGLQEKDIITAVDGIEVNSSNSLTSLIARNRVGETVELTIVRDGQAQKLSVVLEALPEN
ncbi:MAG: trypsin-like peptidase domain-containing protein [Actinobacteria bacterium]|nr:trypsin-like peptidase domain-containing protein [Actinomycetota bacterium]